MNRKIHFMKMHGVGNDYIFVDTALYPVPDPQAAAIAWSRPHMGIGSDGLVLIGRPETPDADFTMRIFNADGSEGLMCGNASRCIGKYVYEQGLTDKTTVRLLTASGIKTLQLAVTADGLVEAVTVDMLAPVFDDRSLYLPEGEPLPEGVFVSMGNPHYVIFVDDIDAGTRQRHHDGLRHRRLCHSGSGSLHRPHAASRPRHHGRRHPRHRLARERQPRLSHRPRHPRL